MTITGGFECFQYFNFETNFLKTENLFPKKLENRFVVENTKIESVTYSYKTTLSEANVKTNRMGSTKCQYLLFFFENFVSV